MGFQPGFVFLDHPESITMKFVFMSAFSWCLAAKLRQKKKDMKTAKFKLSFVFFPPLK